MSNLFREQLRQRILVCDGAMGTMLYTKGIPFQHCFDELNLSQPEMVQEIHTSYIQAGVDIIETNTFGANRYKLAKHGLEQKVREINLAGAQIARQVAREQTLVAGAVGPLGKPLQPIGVVSLEEARIAFQEQIQALVDGGVDLIILETMTDLREMLLALKVAKQVTEHSIIAQMTFNEEGKTIMGDKPEEVVARLRESGADVIGANCSMGPQGILEVIERMACADAKVNLSAQPNAGLPRMMDGRYIYLTSPQYMAEYALRLVQAGANIVGGCCGTTPEHIAAIAEAVKGLEPVRVKQKIPAEAKKVIFVPSFVEVKERPETSMPSRKTSFHERLGKEFLVSVELDPPKGIDTSKLIAGAVLLKNSGVDVVNVADSPLARARMSPLALAHLIMDAVAMETVLHLSCRDRNLLGLQSELMGAYALGVRNILAVTGDPPQLGDYPHATGVFDVDSVGLVHLIKKLNQGVDLMDRTVTEPTSFTVGVAVNPTATHLDEEMKKLEKKVAAGARFAFTQPLFDLKMLETFLTAARPLAIAIFVGILPLRNYKHSEFLHNEVPEIIIPEPIRKRMQQAGDQGMEEGIAIAREFLTEAKDLVDGVYLMPPFNKFEMAVAIIEGIKN